MLLSALPATLLSVNLFLNLNLGTHVNLVGAQEVVDSGENRNSTGHQWSIVHAGGVDRGLRGPQAKEPDDDDKHASKHVVNDAKHARKMPWTPLKNFIITSDVPDLVVLVATTVQKKDGGHEVGSIESRDGNANNRIIHNAGAKIDQTDEAGNEASDGDGPHRHVSSGLDLEIVSFSSEE